MAYIVRLAYYTFYKEGDELVITSQRDESFEARHDWPEEWTMTDEDLYKKLHKNYYIDLMREE